MFRTLFSLQLLFVCLLGAQTYQSNWNSLDQRPIPAWFTDAKFGIFVHWGVYSVPAYAPVIPGKLAYSEWYWHAITEGQKSNAGPVDAGGWEMHKKLYGADYAYANFARQFRAELFDPAHWPMSSSRERPALHAERFELSRGVIPAQSFGRCVLKG